MKASLGLFNAGALAFALAACNTLAPTTEAVDVPGDSAGSAGPGYCETVPSDPDDLTQWNELCAPGDR